ncbi:MAG: hypothetical protein AAGG01_04635 [Planctomycetota bacterium]
MKTHNLSHRVRGAKTQRAEIRRFRKLGAALGLPFLALFGCSTPPDLRATFAQRLAAVNAEVEQENLVQANADLVELIQEITAAQDPRYASQRMLCDALLVRLHASATEESGFLLQPGAFEFDATALQSEQEVVSPTAHRLAAIFHAWHLSEKASQAEEAETPWTARDGDIEVIPSSLSPFLDQSHVSGYVSLMVCASLAELGFQEQAKSMLVKFNDSEGGRLFDPQRFEGLRSAGAERPEEAALTALDRYELSPEQRWHIIHTAHELFRARFDRMKGAVDPTLAYRFGCLAALGELVRDEADEYDVHSGATLDLAVRDRFYAWVEELRQEYGTFVSGDTSMGPGVVESTDSGEPAIRFAWTPAAVSSL